MRRTADLKSLLKRWLKEGSLEQHLPEVAALQGVPQPERYHAEGDAFVHTMLAVEAVDDDADPRVFWAVLLHDIGKALTTKEVEGEVHSYGHAKAGAALVAVVLDRVGEPELAADVAWLVREHMFHHSWNLREDGVLTRQQRRYMEQPLFPLLMEVCAADAAASQGKSVKGRKIELLYEIYVEDVAGEKWPPD